MPQSISLSNNDVVQIVWKTDEKIADCLGFAVYRQEQGKENWTPLPAWVGFEGQPNPAWTRHTTEEWPIQKFEWRDLTARRGGSYRYKIVPVTGNPDAGGPLTAMPGEMLTDFATLTERRGSFSAYFNRGILSTQFLAHQIPTGPSGAPNPAVLKDRIDQPGDPLRLALAGQILEGLEELLKRAVDTGGTVFAALYELNDPDLLAMLLAAPTLHLILSNTGADDETNRAARQALHERAEQTGANYEIIDRFVPSSSIGHNKFCVYVAADGAAKAVLLGSTNWTYTGVCAQSNNALILENSKVAAAYLDYWGRLKKDTQQADARQATELRQSDMRPGAADVDTDGAKTTVWFSPNTPHARASHPGPHEATPPDLANVFALMSAAKHAILFLEFQPGHPSVIDHAAACLDANPSLFVRGAVTDPDALGDFSTRLVHRGGDETTVVAASAVQDQFAFWQKELLKSLGGHAIIHNKIVVIDPMSPDCVVVTGSHNHGYRASYNNDENLMIVRGHKELARAYAVHVMDVYGHYRFRAIVNKSGGQAFSGLKRDDGWQDRYFDPDNPATKDQTVWFGSRTRAKTMADKIMIIRHAEKPGKEPPPFGVNPNGSQDEHDLAVAGWQRAGGLALLLGNGQSAALRPGLAVPVTIMATKPDTKNPSQRPLHTVKPLASVLKTTVFVEFAVGDEKDLAARAETAHGPVLIAWQHEKIAAIAAALTGRSEAEFGEWKDDWFDPIWIFDKTNNGWAFSRTSQGILAGDGPA